MYILVWQVLICAICANCLMEGVWHGIKCLWRFTHGQSIFTDGQFFFYSYKPVTEEKTRFTRWMLRYSYCCKFRSKMFKKISSSAKGETKIWLRLLFKVLFFIWNVSNEGPLSVSHSECASILCQHCSHDKWLSMLRSAFLTEKVSCCLRLDNVVCASPELFSSSRTSH